MKKRVMVVVMVETGENGGEDNMMVVMVKLL
jgi:hypothetical protein